MTLDEQRAKFVSQIKRDRIVCSLVLILQLGLFCCFAIVLTSVAILLSSISAYGFYTVIVTYQERPHEEQSKEGNSPNLGTDLLQKGIPALFAVCASILGFITRQPANKVGELFVQLRIARSRYSSFIARTEAATSWAEYTQVIREYAEIANPIPPNTPKLIVS